MDKLRTITCPIQNEIELFQVSFKQALHGHNSRFQGLLDYVAGSNGKQIRPIILLLSAQLCGKINQKTIDYAVILELLHTATLIHDDVVDGAMERRGQSSVNAMFDNRIAVLLGDYILSLAIINGINTQNQQVLGIMGKLAQNLSEGELSQLIFSRKLSVDEKSYFDVIHKKTAALISSCTELGAISVNASPEDVDFLRQIGENMGLCFQIKDDIFDYFDKGNIGKPTGNDIREGKITLPLLHALNSAPEDISKSMLSLIKKQDFNPEVVSRLIDFAKEYGGIEYAESCMLSLKRKIIAILDKFPESETKTALICLIDYIIEREK